MTAPRADVVIEAGDVDADVRRLEVGSREIVVLLLPLPGCDVSVSFDQDRFLAFVATVRAAAATLPKPS